MMRKKNYPIAQGYRSPRPSDYKPQKEPAYESPRTRQEYLTTYSVQDLRKSYREQSLRETPNDIAQEKVLTARKKEPVGDYVGSGSVRIRDEEVRRSQFQYEAKQKAMAVDKPQRQRSHRNIEINLNFDKGKLTAQDISELLTSKTLQYEHLNGEYLRDRAQWELEKRRLGLELSHHSEEVERLSNTVNTLRVQLSDQDELLKMLTPSSERRRMYSSEEHSRSMRSLGKRQDDEEQILKLRDIEEKTRRLSEMERQERMTAQELMQIIKRLREENLSFRRRYARLHAESSTQTQSQILDTKSQRQQRDSTGTAAAMSESNQQLRTSNQKLERDILSLTFEVSNLLADKTRYMQENSDLREELEESKNNAKAEMEKLMVDINNLADLLVEKEIENDQITPYKEKASELQKINEELRLTLTGYEKLESIKAGERVGLEIQIDQLERELKETRISKESAESLLNELKANLSEAQQQLQSQAKLLEQKDSSCQITKHHEQSKQLIKELSSQISRLNEQLKIVGSELQLNNGLNMELKLQNQALSQKLLQNQSQAKEERQDLIENLDSQVAQVREEVDRINTEHRDQIRHKEEAIRELREQLNKGEEKAEQLEFQRERMELDLKEVWNQQKVLKETLQESQRKVTTLMHKPLTLEFQVQTDQPKVLDREAQTNTIQRKVVDLQTEVTEISRKHAQVQTEKVQANTKNASIQTQSSELKRAEIQTDSVTTKVGNSQTQNNEPTKTVEKVMKHVDTQTEKVQQVKQNQEINVKVQYNVNIQSQSEEPEQPKHEQVSPQTEATIAQLTQQNHKLTNAIGQLQADLKLQKAHKQQIFSEKAKLQEAILERANKHQQQLKTMLNANQKISENMLEVAQRNSELEAEIERLKTEQHDSSSGSFLKVNSNIKLNEENEEVNKSDQSKSKEEQHANLFHIPEESQEDSGKDSHLVVSRLQSLLSDPVQPAPAQDPKTAEANNMVETINELSQLLPQHSHKIQNPQNLSGSGFTKKSYVQEDQGDSQDHSFQIKSSLPSLKSEDVKPFMRGAEWRMAFETKLEEAMEQSKFGKEDSLPKLILEFLKKLYEYHNTDYLIEQAKKLFADIRIYERYTQQKVEALELAIGAYIRKANAVFSYPVADPITEQKPKSQIPSNGQKSQMQSMGKLALDSGLQCKTQIRQEKKKVTISLPVSEISAGLSSQVVSSVMTLQPSQKAQDSNVEKVQEKIEEKIEEKAEKIEDYYDYEHRELEEPEKQLQKLLLFDSASAQAEKEPERQPEVEPPIQMKKKQSKKNPDERLRHTYDSSKVSKLSSNSHKSANSIKPTLSVYSHKSPNTKKVDITEPKFDDDSKGSGSGRTPSGTSSPPSSKFGPGARSQPSKPKEPTTRVTSIKKGAKK